VARLPLAGTVRVVRDGRSVFAGSRALHRTEPPSRRTGRRSLRLALEQCAGASDWQRRRAGQGCPVAGDDSRLAGVSQQRAAGSGTTGHSASFAYWPAFGRRGVPVSPGGHARPRAAAQEAGSEIEQSPQLSHVSPSLEAGKSIDGTLAALEAKLTNV